MPETPHWPTASRASLSASTVESGPIELVRQLETSMGKLGSTIGWLQRQRTNAMQALRDLQSGQKIEFDGTDVTAEWVARYERLIERYGRLIERYEQRELESNLEGAVKFRE